RAPIAGRTRHFDLRRSAMQAAALRRAPCHGVLATSFTRITPHADSALSPTRRGRAFLGWIPAVLPVRRSVVGARDPAMAADLREHGGGADRARARRLARARDGLRLWRRDRCGLPADRDP